MSSSNGRPMQVPAAAHYLQDSLLLLVTCRWKLIETCAPMTQEVQATHIVIQAGVYSIFAL